MMPDNLLNVCENYALLKFSITKIGIENLPETICPLTNTRQFRLSKSFKENGKYIVFCQQLMQELKPLVQNKKFCTRGNFNNVLTVQPKIDILFTGFTLLGKINCPPCVIYDQELECYVDEKQKTEHDITVDVKFENRLKKSNVTFTFYDIAYGSCQNVTLFETTLIPKDCETIITFTIHVESKSIFRNICHQKVNNYLLHNMETNVFKSLFFTDSSIGAPIVIREFEYVRQL